MAKIATCPECTKQLGLPATIAVTDRAECPECHAIFSLSKTVQISLPVARVLDPAEQPVAASLLADDLQFAPIKKEVAKKENVKKENVSEALTSNSAPRKSWEERLKNALALDNSGDEVVSKINKVKAETVVPENDQREVPVTPPSRPPSSEFELDPTPAASTEPKRVETKTVEPKTVKKAAKPKQVALNLELPALVSKQANSPSKTLADFAKGELASAGGGAAALTTLATKMPKVVLPKETKNAVTEVAEVAVQTVSRRRATRSRFSKIAVLGTGAVVGIFGGLYGLLWMQGSKADYLGLARVLPASMLPSVALSSGGLSDGGEEGVGGAPPAEASSPKAVVRVQGTHGNEKVKRDEAVRPASAALPLAATGSSVRVDAKEFSDLVDAAKVALPKFVAGDLSTPGSIQRKGQAYMALCRLAEHFDFANQLGLAPPIQAKAKQAAQLFGQVTYKANVREDLAHIAGRWWEYKQRPSDGIFLAGYVQKTQPAGSRTLCWVKLSKQSTVGEIPVLLDEQRYQTGDQIGVVGSVVSNPRELPPGFSGQQVVGAEYVFSLQMDR